jgi:putative PIN family toxin of toxin-antitoxin system
VAILTETARVLQTKFDWTEDKVRQAIQDISQTATVLRPRPTVHILKDEPDNRILECAIAAQADLVISGDRHLLALKRHADSIIISLADFLARLRK